MFPNRLVTTMGGNVFKDEYSVKFDASDDYITHGNNFNLGTANFTLGMWVKSSAWADGDTRYLMAKKEDGNIFWYLRINTSGYLHFHSAISDGSGGSTTSVYHVDNTDLSTYDGQWMHIMISCSRAGNLIYYVNGAAIVSKGVGSLSAHNLNNSGTFVIGSHTPTSGFDFDGQISEYYIFNSALSASEVATYYNSGRTMDVLNGPKMANMKGWFRCGDGSEGGKYDANAKIYNMSTRGNYFHSNNGTMTNMLPNDIVLDAPPS